MKLMTCILAMIFPVLGWAQLAGQWAGVARDSHGSHPVVLHISGPFTVMKARVNIADQKINNAQVESITFSDSTLRFSAPASDIQYSGVLDNDSGAIAGTLTLHGVGVPLRLARVAAAAAPDIPIEGSVTVDNWHFVHKPSGVEMDLPSGWTVDRTSV